MPTERATLKAHFLSRLRSKPPAVMDGTDLGKLAGRRIDPTLFSLTIARIRPNPAQVRRMNKKASDPEVREIAESIRQVGILQALDVRYVADGDFYQIVAGERRFVAAKLAGLEELPVKLVEADDALVRRLQLLENIHRSNLTPLELSQALQQSLEDGAKQQDLAKLLCKSKSYVTKALAASRNLTDDAKQVIEDAPDSFRSLDQLYEVSKSAREAQPELLRKAAKEHLSRDQVRALARQTKERMHAGDSRPIGRPPQTKAYVKTIPVSQATVIVRFRKARATGEEIRKALQQAIKSLPA